MAWQCSDRAKFLCQSCMRKGAFGRAKFSAKFYAKVAHHKSTVTTLPGIITVSQYRQTVKTLTMTFILKNCAN